MGWVLLLDGKPQRAGTFTLKGSIGKRCLSAYDNTLYLLRTVWPDTELLKIESPVGRFVKALIPQVRVSGAIILACEQEGVEWVEVTPSAAKKALSMSGKASKEEMLRAAASKLGYDPDKLTYVAQKKDRWVALLDGEEVYNEHIADAVGIGLAEVV